MNVYCMRHGESEYNVLGLCNDDPRREVRLTEQGRRQAQAAADALKDVPIERVYCSELPRTRETAEIVNRHHCVPIDIRSAINDIRSGCDGEPVEHYFRAIAHDPLHARSGDGESLMDHKRRILGFLDWLKRQESLDTVLVVAHEETLRVFAAHARGLDDEAMRGLTFGNCQVLSFEL
jgi:probable phosphoglycerate mutase